MFDIQGIAKAILDSVVKSDFLEQVQKKLGANRDLQEWEVVCSRSSPGPGWVPFAASVDNGNHDRVYWMKRIK